MSKKKLLLSVCIMTLNESQNIQACIKSVENADEILIGDTGSSDDTVELARKYTDKIFNLKFLGHAKTKEALALNSTNEWILSLDADERVSLELWREIENIITKEENDHSGMFLRRRSFFLGKQMRIWNNDYQLRLYKKNTAKWNDAIIHCGIDVKGNTIKSIGYLDHYTDPNLRHVLQKMNSYTNASAMYLIKNKKKHINIFSAFVHTFSTFMRIYFVRGAILDGKIGFIFACTQSMFNWFKYLKAWEIKKGIAQMPSMNEFMTV